MRAFWLFSPNIGAGTEASPQTGRIWMVSAEGGSRPVMGLKIPPEVDRGRRLVLMLFGMLDSRAVQDEQAYRRITSAA